MAGPIYKGTKGPTWFKRRRSWQRGRGWTSAVTYRGEPTNIIGQLPSLQAYCTQVDIDDGDGPYAEITGQWSGFGDGQHDEDLQVIWELHQQEIELDALEHPLIKDVFGTGATAVSVRQAIRLAIQKFKKSLDANTSVVLPYRADGFISNLALSPSDQALAYDFFDSIIEGVDHFAVYQPVVQRNLVVSEVFSTYGATPAEPFVYVSTALFASKIGVPTIVVAALPQVGEWLETPPQVQQTSLSKFTITQQWQWANSYSALYYQNRITS